MDSEETDVVKVVTDEIDREAFDRLERVADGIIKLCRENKVEMVGAAMLTWDAETGQKASVSVSRIPMVDLTKMPEERAHRFYQENIKLLLGGLADAMIDKAKEAVVASNTEAMKSVPPFVPTSKPARA